MRVGVKEDSIIILPADKGKATVQANIMVEKMYKNGEAKVTVKI